MKKSILFVILVTLTLVIALSGTGLAFAEEAGADAADTAFTKQDTIKLVATYIAFGLSIVVGIPLIRAVNKRKKQGYVANIVEETEDIAKQVSDFYANRDKARTKKEILKFSLKITGVADHALTTYTEKQISGYYDVYNDLNKLNSMLSDVEKCRDDKDRFEAEYLALVKLAASISDKAKILKDNEDIIRRYNND